MAKKVRRVRQKSTGAPANQLPETSPDRSSKTARSMTTEEELREQYAYVLRDLRRVAFLAAAMFILLIVLNLLLR